MSTEPFIDKQAQKSLLENVAHNAKHKLMTLLMLDGGLRVTEVASLRISYFDFQNQLLTIPSLKKRSPKPIFRQIPLTTRVMGTLATYYDTLPDKTGAAFLFPSHSKSGHIGRISIWRMIKKHTNKQTSPHKLRHTFATKLNRQGNDIKIIKDLLGHTSQRTTEIYLHTSEDQRQAAIQSIDKTTLFQKIKRRCSRPKSIFYHGDPQKLKVKHSGREVELKRLYHLKHRKINTIVLGPQGVGKSHLLNQLKGDKILRLDDFKAVKTTIGSILLKLFDGDKDKIITLLTKQTDINKVVTRQSIPQLITLLKSSTEPQEYTIIIDDLTHTTQAGVAALEKLNDHFHIMAAARQLKMSQASFLSNFERIDLKTLSRAESSKLTKSLSRTLMPRIKDYDTFQNHIYEQTNGNPKYIIELIHRSAKEPVLSRTTINDIKHTTALPEYDMSIPLVVAISSLMVLRYLGRELQDDAGAFGLIGGAFLIFALYGRSIFSYGKRRFI